MSGVDNMGAPDIMREELAKLVRMARKSSQERDDSSIASVLENIDANLSTGLAGDDAIAALARSLLDALSTSGLPSKIKLELSQRARTIWKGWKVELKDVEFLRKANGDRKRLGKGSFADVYLARMPERDEGGKIIDGKYIKVAVKQFNVQRSDAQEVLPQFTREVFLQASAQHDCVVRTYGGHWPSPDEIEDGDVSIEPIIVMERMTHNLRDVLKQGLLNSLDMKRQVLIDIAEGIGHLHSCGIVHRDIRPENILMRVVDGEITGRAKVCDFGVSRKAELTDLMAHTTQAFTKPAGSSHYMPPEAFNSAARDTSRRARDLWSFGVVMCEVLQPEFLKKLVQAHSNASPIEFAKKVAAYAQNLSCDLVLDQTAISCLLLDPILRPRMENLTSTIRSNLSVSEISFFIRYSQEHRANQVLQFMRTHLKFRRSELNESVTKLEEVVRNDSCTLAQSLLGFCHYYGIGIEKNKETGKNLFRKSSKAGDSMALCAMGSIYYRSSEKVKAYSKFAAAASSGSTEAKIWLAMCTRFGYGTTKDEKKAFQILSSAAEEGNMDAEANLPEYFKDGIGTRKDEQKAVKILHKLSTNGNPYATKTLAYWYQDGILVQKSEETAQQLMNLASKRGITDSWESDSQGLWSYAWWDE